MNNLNDDILIIFVYLMAVLFQFWYETVDHTAVDYGPALLEIISPDEEQRLIDEEFYLQLGAGGRSAGKSVLHLGRDSAHDVVLHRVQQVRPWQYVHYQNGMGMIRTNHLLALCFEESVITVLLGNNNKIFLLCQTRYSLLEFSIYRYMCSRTASLCNQFCNCV